MLVHVDEAGADPAAALRHLHRGDHGWPEDVHQVPRGEQLHQGYAFLQTKPRGRKPVITLNCINIDT